MDKNGCKNCRLVRLDSFLCVFAGRGAARSPICVGRMCPSPPDCWWRSGAGATSGGAAAGSGGRRTTLGQEVSRWHVITMCSTHMGSASQVLSLSTGRRFLSFLHHGIPRLDTTIFRHCLVSLLGSETEEALVVVLARTEVKKHWKNSMALSSKPLLVMYTRE